MTDGVRPQLAPPHSERDHQHQQPRQTAPCWGWGCCCALTQSEGSSQPGIGLRERLKIETVTSPSPPRSEMSTSTATLGFKAVAEAASGWAQLGGDETSSRNSCPAGGSRCSISLSSPGPLSPAPRPTPPGQVPFLLPMGWASTSQPPAACLSLRSGGGRGSTICIASSCLVSSASAKAGAKRTGSLLSGHRGTSPRYCKIGSPKKDKVLLFFLFYYFVFCFFKKRHFCTGHKI